MKYSKALAEYYFKWFADCHDSAIYCMKNGDEIRAQSYLRDAEKYLTIIMENYDELVKLEKK